jgi:Rrf2 family iron-sulfur cluster assembly transcriptional regulator
MFSKDCEYRIRSLIWIAVKSNKGERVNVTSITKQIDSPTAFTAKILQKLVKGGIVLSAKGPRGGFEITPVQMEETSLATIVEVLDGATIYNGYGLGLATCSEEKPCPIHF